MPKLAWISQAGIRFSHIFKGGYYNLFSTWVNDRLSQFKIVKYFNNWINIRACIGWYAWGPFLSRLQSCFTHFRGVVFFLSCTFVRKLADDVVLTNNVVLTVAVRRSWCCLIPHLGATVSGHRLVVADRSLLLRSGDRGVSDRRSALDGVFDLFFCRWWCGAHSGVVFWL